jgi:hypothetical protein
MNDLAIFAITLIGVGVLLIAKTITIVSQSDIYVIECTLQKTKPSTVILTLSLVITD